MRTNLRSYHPVPSLQKADPNLQDAPRIKNILKACHLPDEADHIPVTPAELQAKIVSPLHGACAINPDAHPLPQAEGASPSTSIVNLLFVLSNHFTVSPPVPCSYPHNLPADVT
jgi:Ino eighty subunit 1